MTYLGGFGLAGCATCAVVASVMLRPVSLVARLLSVRPLQFLGRISYGMYLRHFPLFLIIDGQRTGLRTYPLFLARSAVTIVVASMSYYWLEQPIRRMHRPAHLGQKMLIAAGTVATTGIVLATGLPTSGQPATDLASGAQVAGQLPIGGQPTSTILDNPQIVRYHSPVSASAAAGLAGVLIVGDSLAETLGNGVSRYVPMFFGIQDRLSGGLVSAGPYFELDVINGVTFDCALTTGL